MARLDTILAGRLAVLPRAMSSANLLMRDAPGGLEAPDCRSANRHSRLLEAQDGWVALSLARPEDRDVIPALTGSDAPGWEALAAAIRAEPATQFRDRAIELQLPVAVLGEAPAMPLRPAMGGKVPRRVVDMSALWAGPLCAGLLAQGGAEVLRIESRLRPDPTSHTSPELDRRINGGKRRLALDLSNATDRAKLMVEIRNADVLVTSARAAALVRLGLAPDALLAECPGLTWVAITGHGFFGKGAARVGFGDDCAVAGGLVQWDGTKPRFLGDALADPLTGLEAALSVLRQMAIGHGGLLDIVMAQVAAGYAGALQPCG